MTENAQQPPAADAMTSPQRLRAALTGRPVDRVCIWLREGLNPLGEPADAENFQRGWQADPLYHELIEYARPWADDFSGWGGPWNRWCLVPWETIERETIEETDRHRRTRITIHTPRGDLHSVTEVHRNEATGWVIEPMVADFEQLKMLASVAYETGEEHIDRAVERYVHARDRVGVDGRRGLCRLGLSSPMVCISGAMHLELFLELSWTEREWIKGLCQEITDRMLHVLGRIWDRAAERGIEIDTVVCTGGSEQCTPPMMAPEMYDELVVPYEGQIFDWAIARGCIPMVHCHGKVRHALKGMLEMGVQATDPVEPPPAGDVTYAEARRIVGDRMTLMGNLEFDELEYAEPDHIRARVREILSLGTTRLVLGASAGPITHVTRRLVDNYKAWIDTALEYGT